MDERHPRICTSDPIGLPWHTKLLRACNSKLMGVIAFGLTSWIVSMKIGPDVEQLVDTPNQRSTIVEDRIGLSWDLMAPIIRSGVRKVDWSVLKETGSRRKDIQIS